jgi:hypothetical protein
MPDRRHGEGGREDGRPQGPPRPAAFEAEESPGASGGSAGQPHRISGQGAHGNVARRQPTRLFTGESEAQP